MRSIFSRVMWVGRTTVFTVGFARRTGGAGIAVVLVAPLLAGCTAGGGQGQASEKKAEECAKTETKAAKAELSKPGKIAFSKGGDIYTMNPDGSDETDLTAKSFGDAFYEVDPDWSPDGKKIAFSSDRGDDYDFNIYVMNSDGTDVTQVTDAPGDEAETKWSPDGKKIGFTTEANEKFTLSVMNSDGTEFTTIRKGPSPGYIGMSDWSPDGSRIVFVVDKSYTGGQIDTFVMNEDDTCVKQLTDVSGDDATARWSPDGKKILFGSNRKGSGRYLMNPDGTDVERILQEPPSVAGADALRPAWSPNGKKITWTAKYEGDIGSKIYVMNADGSGLTAIHGELETATSLDWQPVGG